MLVVNLTITAGSCLTVQGTSLEETGFGAVLGMSSVIRRADCFGGPSGTVFGCPALGGVSQHVWHMCGVNNQGNGDLSLPVTAEYRCNHCFQNSIVFTRL